jgi:hypothetical protein
VRFPGHALLLRTVQPLVTENVRMTADHFRRDRIDDVNSPSLWLQCLIVEAGIPVSLDAALLLPVVI